MYPCNVGLVKLLALATIFEILGFSCTVNDATPDGGERIDARVLSPVPGLSFSPDGLGYCCPIASASCDCVGTGGFVPIGDPRRCPTFGTTRATVARYFFFSKVIETELMQ